jgi:glyoxalase superfamily protein
VDISIRNIVFECLDDSSSGGGESGSRQLASFYAALLGMRIIREDWLVIAEDEKVVPRLAFDDAPPEYVPPRWGDPERPTQVHLDVEVPDLDRAESDVVRSGAAPLASWDDRRAYSDPAGHPFFLYPSAAGSLPASGPGRIRRVVFDCSSPRGLAPFYEDLMDWRVRLEDNLDRVVIAADHGQSPMLAFERVTPHVPPRWPEPAFPQQIHLDFDVDDSSAAGERAARLGAIRLPEMGGSCPVLADPSAHPFCLCGPND